MLYTMIQLFFCILSIVEILIKNSWNYIVDVCGIITPFIIAWISSNYSKKKKKKILEDNKDKIEWIEITETGTSYIIRVEERKIKEDNDDNVSYDIVSSKNAIIYSIEATSGEKVKKTNDYVTKGDVIISGSITKPDGNKIIGTAKGEVYGEVWYVVEVDYPFIYKEETQTGKVKEVYVINFLGHRISLFDFLLQYLY